MKPKLLVVGSVLALVALYFAAVYSTQKTYLTRIEWTEKTPAGLIRTSMEWTESSGGRSPLSLRKV